MPTQEEYRKRLQPLIKEAFAPQPSSSFSPPPPSPSPYIVRRSRLHEERISLSEEEAEHIQDKMSALLYELEQQNESAGIHMRSAGAVEEDATMPAGIVPPSADVLPFKRSKKGLLLHYLHNPPENMRREIDSLPGLKKLWHIASQAAAPSVVEPRILNQLTYISRTKAACNEWGDIYGTGKYEMLDLGWAWVLKNIFLNFLPEWLGDGNGVRRFVQHDWTEPVRLQPGKEGQVRIAVIGDWGSGKYRLAGLPGSDGPACAVMDTLGSLPQPPDYIIHLGDTYYTGTGMNRSPEGEEIDNLLEILKLYPKIARSGNCFTLNSNHEMYGGAHGYYAALFNPLFSRQKGCSYFALEFGDWIIAGLDSAYFTPSALYMDGGLGRRGKDPQYDFLQQIKAAQAAGRKVILMSHHPGVTPDGRKFTRLWTDVGFSPDYWYWGHLHLGIFYNAKACSTTRCRCIGHSSMPFAVPPRMEHCKDYVDWYSKTPLASGTNRAKNGFALLTLSEKGITEEVYDIGNTQPVWRDEMR